MLNTTIDISKTADFLVIHFNGANRTFDKETTDTTAIHPISKRCEESLELLTEEFGLTAISGVVLIDKLGGSIIDKLLESGFVEHTVFTDKLIN